ncbi:Glutamine cyclotransferase [hydrothermal vent metagenome]|uniref:Glutamine cyclotransferase n=1 Tax=hydrothermal vent metagenome TaxID=652676 RepID=A0A3B0VNM5_9ZZZZ
MKILFKNKFSGILYLVCFAFVVNAQSLKKPDSKTHPDNCFTQGLIINNNMVWETCGGYGSSRLIYWSLETGKILKQTKFGNKLFAEGLTELNGHLFMLTWQAGLAFEINPETLKVIQQHHYKGQGWGLTTDGEQLIMSNGSDLLQFINPTTFKVEKTVRVHMQDTPIHNLNELEWIDGKVWANVYQTDYIVAIDPETGAVEQRFEFPDLLAGHRKPGVLNGIAYDNQTKKVWVTGKNWPLLFEILTNNADKQ